MENFFKTTIITFLTIISSTLTVCREHKTACGGVPADVFFVLDASSSIWGPHFTKQLQFVRSVSAQFQISPTHTRVAVLTYGTYARLEFDLTSHHGKESTLRSIKNIYQLRGGTRTDSALSRMRELMSREKRRGITQIAIVITDGRSDYPLKTKIEADLTHRAGISVMALGIGAKVDREELEVIASKDDYVFNAESFEALDTLKKILALKTCEVSSVRADESDKKGGNPENDGSPWGNSRMENEILTPPPKGCGGKPADIVFIIDGSRSIWLPDFKKQLKFVQDLVGSFDISPTTTRIGAVTFGSRLHREFHIGDFETEAEVKKAVGKIRHLRGVGTNTAKALQHLRTHYFTQERVRPGVVRMGIVITDGRSDFPSDTAIQARNARKAGIHLFAIGVGRYAEFRELAAIASQPTSTHVFKVDNYDALGSIRELLAIEACKVTNPPTTTPIPTTTTTPMPTTTTTIPTTTTTPTTPMPADQGCGPNSPVDLVFALPPTAKPDDTNTALDFMKDLVQEFDIKDGSIRMGLVPKECLSVPGFNLRSFENENEVLESFRTERQYVQASTSDVLHHMRSESFFDLGDDYEFPEYETDDQLEIEDDMMLGDQPQFAAAMRPEPKHKKIGIILLENESFDLKGTVKEAELTKTDGIEIFVVSVGKDITDEEAMAIASSEKHIFHTPDYAGLSGLKEKMLETLNDSCSGVL